MLWTNLPATCRLRRSAVNRFISACFLRMFLICSTADRWVSQESSRPCQTHQFVEVSEVVDQRSSQRFPR